MWPSRVWFVASAIRVRLRASANSWLPVAKKITERRQRASQKDLRAHGMLDREIELSFLDCRKRIQ